MSGLFKRVLKRKDRGDGGPIRYEEAKKTARHQDAGERQRLAGREDVKPEILYFLAEDESPAVRRVIAANAKTPRQADRLLAEDVDDEVRCEIALKIGRLVPHLSEEEQGQLQELTFEIVELLANDQLPRVRQIIAEEIKHCGSVPRHVIKHLAKDIELIVCAPVLEYSPLLSDEDLLEIINSEPVQGALGAISRRTPVNEPVADAVNASNDTAAIAALLANPSAQIREETLDGIIDRAPKEEVWHEPLVGRPELSVRAIRRIASFVALALLRVLEDRNDLSSEAAGEVRQAVGRRIKKSGVDGVMSAGFDAKKAFAANTLDDESVNAALDRGDRDFVTEALSLKSDRTLVIVQKVLGSQNAKSVTALAWAAGLSMRTAIQIQLRVAKIPPSTVMNAKDGVDYPLSPSELKWYVDLFSD